MMEFTQLKMLLITLLGKLLLVPAEKPTQSYTLNLKLPSIPESYTLYVAESKDNFIAQEYKLPSLLAYFGQQFGFDINSPIQAKMTNVALYKHQAKSVSDLKAEIPFKTRKIQEACLVGSSSICRKCSTGKLENGLYVPTDTNAVKMLLFSEYLQINEHVSPITTSISLSNTAAYTVSFNFRMASVLKRILFNLRKELQNISV